MQDNSAKIFSDNWNVYQKLIRFNYMYHAEFFALTSSVFDEIKPGPFTILDIGCGDASLLKPFFKTKKTESYTGYDLSAPALELAKENLSAFDFDISLLQGDMLGLIQQEIKQFNLVQASFAVHHLQDEDKKQMLHECFKRLNKDGVMIYTDVFRKPFVNHKEYFEEYFSLMDTRWTELTAEEIVLVHEHVFNFDFPSEINETIDWIKQTGFHLADVNSPDNCHTMLVLHKQ